MWAMSQTNPRNLRLKINEDQDFLLQNDNVSKVVRGETLESIIKR